MILLRRIGFRTICIVIFCAASFVSQAQNNKRFRHLNINNGLAHADATCIEQDMKGFIWIGTYSGLQRFDGRELKTFLNETSAYRDVFNNRIAVLRIQKDLLWVGSEGGLNCFDLKTEKYITFQYSDSTLNNGIGLVSNIEVFGNNIWITSNNILYCCIIELSDLTIHVKEPSDIIKNFPEDLLNADFLSLESNDKDILWVGSSRGLAVLNINDENATFNTLFNNRTPDVTLSFDLVEDLFFADNKLWLRSGSVYQVLTLNEDNYQVRNSLKTIRITSLTTDSKLRTAFYSGFTVDNDENLWCTSNFGLVLIENPISEQPFLRIFRNSQYDPFSISGNALSDIFIDRSNCLWVSLWGSGVSYLDLEQKKFNLLTVNPDQPDYSLKASFVRAFAEDQDGKIWIGLRDYGIDIFDPKTGVCKVLSDIYPGKFTLSGNGIRSLKIKGNRVLAGLLKGIDILDIEKKTIRRISQGQNNYELSPAMVYALETDNHGQIWAGLWGAGINIIRTKDDSYEILKISTDKTQPFPLSSDFVSNLFFDEQKNEILASTNHGLNRIILDSEGNISNIIYYMGNGSDGSLSSEYIWPLVKQNDSVYWVGTLGGGLNKLLIYGDWDENNMGRYSAVSYTVKDGAPGNDIESILKDDSGNLWLGGKGLSKFSMALEKFWNFDINDGLQSNGFKIGSAFKSRDGTLYFGGISGLNYFRPDDIKSNIKKPVPVLTSLKLHNQEITPGGLVNNRMLLVEGIQYTKSIKLNYKENDFSISFSSLHFANPEKCSYKYMMTGYDRDWNYIDGMYPVANYSNLRYGTYIFRLDATNNDGLWSGNPTSLKVRILPPWWMSPWAYIGYFILFSLVVFGIYYNISRWSGLRNNLKHVEAEERKMEEIHQIKLQFFTNISHEFRTPLTLILLPAEKLISEKNSPHEQKKLLNLIISNADRLLKLVNEIMDFRKVEAGKMSLQAQNLDFTEFCNNIFHQFVQYSKQKNLSVNFNPGEKTLLWFDAEMMSKILFNLFSNAIKYTNNGGSIDVEIFQGSPEDLEPFFQNKYEINGDKSVTRFCFIKVRDDGIGISEESISHIFDRYYQIHKPSDRHLGTGVGLALLKSLVLLHHGHILVSSKRYTGTEIILGFPTGNNHLKPEEILDVNVLSPALENLVGKSNENTVFQTDEQQEVPDFENISSILIVEDDDELRKLLIDHYSSRYKVLGASDGQQGFEIAAKETPSLIISDVMMPEVDGLGMIRLLKQDIHTCHIPIILLTARSSVESQIEGIEIGAIEYITKPFNIKLLDARIDQLLETLKMLKVKYASDVFAPTRDIVRNQKDQKFLEDLFDLIDKDINNSELSVDGISRALGIGRSNLYKKIKSLTDQSLGDFIRSYRLKKAAKILLTEDVTVSEVIYRVGMNSHSYFTKSFKAQFNLTPSEFVRQNLSKKEEAL